MKTLWIGLSVVISFAGVRAAERPNVLLIISDDQGYGDFGFTGNKVLKTPNLDRLAAESAVFKNFVVAPACSPTRASLLTGRNHMLTGTWGVGQRANMQRDEVRMPRYFQAAGYATGYFGKRDSIQFMELHPWDLGCDESECVWGYVHHNPKMFTRSGIVEKKGWTCDIDVANALDFIKRQGDKPWWCTVAYILPHLPWQPDDRFAKPYRDAGHSKALADCYGSISQMDDATGRLLKGLEALRQADKTIVVFVSDNGPSGKGLSEEEWKTRNTLNMQGAKASAWENGIRVPLLVRWPGRIEPGERKQFGSVEDILPTVADLTGLDSARFPTHLPWHGISLRPVLENANAPEQDRAVFRVAIAGEGGAGGRRALVNDSKTLPMDEQHVTVRGPRFKFHQYVGGKTALYDVVADPSEATDVSAQFPEVAKRYAAELDAKYKEITQSGRAYRMAVVMVGANGDGMNQLDGIMAQRVTGAVRGVGVDGVRGFVAPGDSVEYGIEVREPGSFEVLFLGEKLDQGNGWKLEIAGQTVPLRKAETGRLTFGPINLATSGSATVVLSVDSKGGSKDNQPFVAKVRFSPKQ